MRILQIDAVHFGGLSLDTPLKLDGGLNIWIANNQAGKTTLLTFLEWMLYGPPSRRGVRDLQAIKRWAPWDGSQPAGSIVLLPELKDWPGELLITARFNDYFVQVSEYRTQRALPERVAVSKAGEWNLGQQLLNLSRESFHSSLIAYQGGLVEPLMRSNLRQVLTSDLGNLVVNPDVAQVDRVLAALDRPTFVLGNGQSRTLKEHNMALTRELDILQLERTALQQRLGEFKDLLNHRDSLNMQLEHEESAFAGLDRQARQLELARNYFLLVANKPAQTAPEEVDGLAQEHPEYLNVTVELEREVSRLAGQAEATEEQLKRAQAELARLQAELTAEKLRVTAVPDTAAASERDQALRSAASAVNAAQDELQTAERRFSSLQEKVPGRLRSRFDDLERLYAPHRANLTAISEWQKEQDSINAQLAQLRERRAELQVLSRVQLPKTFYLGIVLTVVSLLVPAFLDVHLGPFKWVSYLLMGVLLIVAAMLISPYWKMRKSTGPAATELRQQVVPEIERFTAMLTAQDRKRRRFLELYELDRPTWDKLVDNINEYAQLDLQLREFTTQQRDIETFRRRLNAAWRQVGEILPLAPLSVDPNWLAQRVSEQGQAGGTSSNMAALTSRVEQTAQEVQHLTQLFDQQKSSIAAQLEPIGLGAQVQSGLRNALDAFRGIADRVRLLSQSSERQAAFAQVSRGMTMDERDFEERWQVLSAGEQSRIAQLAGLPEGFESVCARLQELAKARQEAEGQQEKLRRALDGLKDELNEYARIDREAEDMNRRLAKARENFAAVERWDKAIKVSKRLIDALVDRATQNIAPEVDRALKQVLASAPVEKLREARLGKNMELELSVEGAPADIALDEVWTYLSSGAQQQLGLALRLAMARTASGRTDLPLLLDEPLAELDDEHAEKMFAHLARLAEGTQMIVTTCHERLYDWLLQNQPKVNKISVPAK